MIATRALGVACALFAAVVPTGCGPSDAASSGRPDRAAGPGIAVELPPGWRRATARLTPSLVDPREVLSVATFPLRYRPTGCAHVPGSALEDLGQGDVLMTLLERGLDPRSTWSGFPQRPAHFGPQLGGPSEASACVPSARFTDRFFEFTDGSRHFHVLVAFGPNVADAVRREAWETLDSLEIDPRSRPDWPSSG